MILLYRNIMCLYCPARLSGWYKVSSSSWAIVMNSAVIKKDGHSHKSHGAHYDRDGTHK
jgi:hypothetical protein